MDETDTQPRPLEHIDTMDLIEELEKRHVASLIVLERKSKNGGKNETLTQYNGGISTCIGLAARCHHRLLRASEGDPD